MKHWTMNEINFVRDNIELTDAELAEHLGRTAPSVEHMRRMQGMYKRQPIGYDEVQLMRNNPHIDRHEYAKLTGRSINSYYYLKQLATAI